MVKTALFSQVSIFLLFFTNLACALTCPVTTDVQINTCSLNSTNADITVTNSGSVIGLVDAAAIRISSSSSVSTSIVNYGLIQNELNQFFAILNSYVPTSSGAVINLLSNYGTISGSIGIYNESLLNATSFKATISNLNNSGTIQGVSYGIYNGINGIINTLNNNGTIIGNTASIFSATNAKIYVLNNLQGQNGALTLSGKLPVAYNVIIRSSTDYGKLLFTDLGISGQTAFGINNASSLVATTYSGVLNGISPSQISNLSNSSVNGTYGSFSWSLVNTSGTSWDLIVFSNNSNDTNNQASTPNSQQSITAGQTITSNSLAAGQRLTIGSGGTLQLIAKSTLSNPITLTTGTSTITAPAGEKSVLSGIISGSGSLLLNGSGKLVLSGLNTYSGGTEVSSGATLTLGSATSTGSGNVLIQSGGTLTGIGNISGELSISGTIKPGNSPGYLTTSGNLTLNSGAIYQQDIAGTIQASNTSPVGNSGYYSFMNVGSQFTINNNAILNPTLQNLFEPTDLGLALYEAYNNFYDVPLLRTIGSPCFITVLIAVVPNRLLYNCLLASRSLEY